MTKAIGFGVNKKGEKVKELEIIRRDLTNFDVSVKILYCGICHSDKHHIRNDWGDSKFPLIPGHEIIGIVDDIGSNVSQVLIGDYVAIGNMTDSCQVCSNCEKGEEQYCLNEGPTWVYNGNERLDGRGGRTLLPLGSPT